MDFYIKIYIILSTVISRALKNMGIKYQKMRYIDRLRSLAPEPAPKMNYFWGN